MALQKLGTADQQWVDRTLAGLTTHEKIGQVLVPRLTRNSAEPQTVAQWVEKYQMGGGHTFGGDVAATRTIVQEAQQASKIPMLISGDLEQGAGSRIAQLTQFAGQLALGAADDLSLAYRMGEAIAVEGRAAGFSWMFGPVVDLSINPNNLSHIRCLGSNPRRVSELAVAIIKGAQEHGLAACAKHFPGAGLDDLDSHLTTAINPLPRAQWLKLSAAPFKAAIKAGVWTIMASPSALPKVDRDCGDKIFPRPVMVSKYMMTDVLRGEFGFEGLVITDAVTMGGLTMHERRLDMLAECFNAGNDMLLFVRRLDSIIEFFENCLRTRRIKEARLEEAVRRVLELKARLGLHRGQALIPQAEAERIAAHPPYGPDAERLAERSITLLRDKKKAVPMTFKAGAGGKRVGSILITNRPDFKLDIFEAVLRQAGCQVTSLKNPADPEELYDRVESGEFDQLIISLFYAPQWGWSTDRCHGPESRCMMSGFPFAHPKVQPIFISWANPYHLYEFGFMDPYINTYGAGPGTQKACGRALLGQIPIVGKSPIAQPPFFKVGDGLRRLARRK